ncbi:MAG TPA: hypothetical protein VKA19_10805, partial [Alphaproteobacteria bacterium]|nr:hypothetical protein [Alphaproteobacteria bacterium]
PDVIQAVLDHTADIATGMKNADIGHKRQMLGIAVESHEIDISRPHLFQPDFRAARSVKMRPQRMTGRQPPVAGGVIA